MFEKAARLKLRFNYKGLCTVEDLWDISLQDLDGIFKELNARLKEREGESLLDIQSREDETLALLISIVKHVVKVRLQERKTHADAVAKAVKKQKILGVISKKQDAELDEMSVDDLTKLIDEL